MTDPHFAFSPYLCQNLNFPWIGRQKGISTINNLLIPFCIPFVYSHGQDARATEDWRLKADSLKLFPTYRRRGLYCLRYLVIERFSVCRSVLLLLLLFYDYQMGRGSSPRTHRRHYFRLWWNRYCLNQLRVLAIFETHLYVLYRGAWPGKLLVVVRLFAEWFFDR